MFALIIVLSLIDLVFGVILIFTGFKTGTWYIGISIILSSLIMMWLAGGAKLAYDRDSKMRKGIDYLGIEYKSEQDRLFKALCKKLNVSPDEIKKMAEIEGINSQKDIKLDDLPHGFKVVLKKQKALKNGISFEAGTIGVIGAHEKGSAFWDILVIDRNGKDYILRCSQEEIENYYLNEYKKAIYLEQYKDELEEEIKKREKKGQ